MFCRRSDQITLIHYVDITSHLRLVNNYCYKCRLLIPLLIVVVTINKTIISAASLLYFITIIIIIINAFVQIKPCFTITPVLSD